MSIKNLFLSILILSASINAYAVDQETTLSVEGMTCASCLYQVEKALSGVAGVKEATVEAKTREAVVVFDDSQTNVKELAAAATNAGFPSTVKKTN